MPTPAFLFTLPDGQKIAAIAVDDLPADWQTVRYVPTIEEHPDIPGQPIQRWRSIGSVAADLFITEDGENLTEDGNFLTE